jgi:hypothetical protein
MIANNTVAIDPYKAPFLSPYIKEWWAYVTVAPLDKSITVLRSGSSKGFTGRVSALLQLPSEPYVIVSHHTARPQTHSEVLINLESISHF